ncbi:coat protein [Cordyline virus 2]|uniref:Coat protein n=1 Tax=Cordyline virus 2 TaxID=1177751 RepID=L7P0B5_9CLOS|nr:coat protein [Cordyline virus 2]AFJ05051.1 coat protein [Cordyline virus 2]
MAQTSLATLFGRADYLKGEAAKPSSSRLPSYASDLAKLAADFKTFLDSNPSLTNDQKRSFASTYDYSSILPESTLEQLRQLLTTTNKDGSTQETEIKRFNISDLIKKGVNLPRFKTQPQPANELTSEQVQWFYDSLEEYFKYQVYNKSESDTLSDDEIIAFLASYFASLVEQSTSKENANNKNLLNTFTLGDNEYVWDRAKFIRYIDNKFSEKGFKVENIERRFGRSETERITTILQKVDYKPSERLPTQWGVLDNTRAQISDFIAVYKSTATPKSQSAQVAASEYATSKQGKNNSAVHVSQVLGKNNMQRY